MVLFEFAGGDARRTAEVYQAYLDAGGPARLNRRGSFTMVIAQFGHFWEKAVTAYLAPVSSPEERAHSLERVEQALNTPLRLEHIDAMLNWVSPVR